MSRKTRKLMWSVPLIAAVAVIGALAAFMTLQPNDAAAQGITATGKDLPGMVQNLMVEPNIEAEGGIPQEQLKVSWEPPTEGGAVVSYRIDLSFNGTEWYSYVTDHRSSDLQVIYGDEADADANEAPLMANTTRYFRVFAFNQQGIGPGVSMMGTTSASMKPDPASNLMAAAATTAIDLNADDDVIDTCEVASEIGKSAITLTWTAPEDPPGADVESYRIEWSNDGNRWFLLEESIEADGTYTDTGLLANTTRHYRIYAINSVGMSLVSEESAVATTLVSAIPALPTAIEYILLSPDSTDVHIKWTEPTDPCGDPVSDYQIQARPSNIHTAAAIAADAANAAPDDDGTAIDHDNDPDTPNVDPATLWKNLHTGKYTDRERLNGLYVFGGDDVGSGFTASTLLNIRIKTINRTGEAGSQTGGTLADQWLLMNQVPVGDSNLPRRQGNPRVEQDRMQNEGRTGLNVSWPAATFNANKAPADEDPASDHDTDVSYVLVIDGDEEDADDSQRNGTADDGTAATTETTRSHVGADDSRQSTNDDGLHAEDMRSYQVFPIRASADLEGAFAITGTGVSTTTTDVIRGFPSREVSGRTARPLHAGVPINLAATAGGHTEIDLSWGAPVEDPDNPCSAEGTTGFVRLGGAVPVAETEDDGSECGMSVLTGYRVDISETGTSGWTTLETVGPDDDDMIPTRYTADGLTPAKRYYFRVAAMNSRGAGNNTNHVSTDTDTADLPTPPGGLVVQAVSTTQLKMCWYEHNLVDPLTGDAILDEGLPVLGYRITYVMGEGDDATEMMLVSHTMSTETVYTDPSTLMPGSSRTYRVRSITLGNVGMVGGSDITLGGTPYSEASASTMQAAPTGLTAMASYDSATMMHSITVTWDAGGDAIDAYEVEGAYMMDDGSMSDWMAVDPAHMGTDATYTDSDLMAGTMYYYRVRSLISTIPSAWSDAMSATTHDVPGMPAVTASATSDTEITVTWTAEDMGSAITGYMVERGTMGADNTMTWTAVDPAHTMDMGMMYMDSGLAEMTKYYYRVMAMNAVGDGEWSDGMAYAMTDRTNVAPETVGTIAAVTVTEGMMSPAMDVSMYFSDADPEDATLTYSAASDMMQYATASVSGSMITINGVAAGMATIMVTATDGMGETATQSITVTVASASTELTRPTNVRAVSNAAGELTLTWEGADNADFFLLIAVDLDSVGTGSLDYDRSRINDGSATTGNVTGLNSGSSYLGIVIAVQSDGTFLHLTAGTITVQ